MYHMMFSGGEFWKEKVTIELCGREKKTFQQYPQSNPWNIPMSY